MQNIHLSACPVEDIIRILGTYNSKKCLLVKDASFPFLPFAEELTEALPQCPSFADFTPNPLYEDVMKGVSVYNSCGCDAIVAIGGGSTIDVAKCIKLFSATPEGACALRLPYADTGIPVIAIPTTAGTGSESTCFAVIYYNDTKQSVSHKSLVPDVALLCPSVLKTLPVYQKKCTALDALCQAVESFWSVRSTEESKALSARAMRLIAGNLIPYIEDTDPLAGEQLMVAANLAGQAICITTTTAAHAMSYKITSHYHLPHGHAVAICFAEVLDFMLNRPEKCIDCRGNDYVYGTLEEIARILSGVSDGCFAGADTAQEFLATFRSLLNRMDIGNPVRLNGEELQALSASVNPERLSNHPFKMDYNDFMELYGRITVAASQEDGR